jgi:hypothetical protein
MKKKYVILSIIVCLGVCAQSCKDYLDVGRYFQDRQDMERIFNNRDYTEQWLASAYGQLLNFNLEIGHTRYTVTNFSDDMIFTENAPGMTYADYKFGKYGPQYGGQVAKLVEEPWKQSYAGIRQASIFLKHVHPGPEIDESRCRDLKGQAYFIRGYLYWLLLQKYGPVPILPEDGLDYEDEYSQLSRPRNSYDECAEYISEQMLLAAELLPAQSRDSRNVSRPIRGTALSVRAKAYLYAASPLMNGNPDMVEFRDNTGRQLISQEPDNSKWAKAAAAALDVIKLNQYHLYTINKRPNGDKFGAYPKSVEPPAHPVYSNADFPNGWANIDPFESYRSLFNGDLYVKENPELIFSRGTNQATDSEAGIQAKVRHQMPLGRASGYNCHGLTGKQCDAYAMRDGKPFNRATSPRGFTSTDAQYDFLKQDVWLEYANREPRFYASVAFAGANWPCTSASDIGNQNFQEFYYYGENSGRNAVSSNDRWVPTGIGMMKFVNPKDSYNNGTQYPKVEVSLRYADILLMYVEALNELTMPYQIPSWNGEETYIVSRDINEMKKTILPVRLRAGLPNYDELDDGDPYSDAAELRKYIKRERQIEFLGENQRYYDLRRWKDAPREEGEMIFGCNTTITKAGREYFYEQVEIPSIQVAWSKKKYFWPVSFAELQKNSALTQAPGWQSYD